MRVRLLSLVTAGVTGLSVLASPAVQATPTAQASPAGPAPAGSCRSFCTATPASAGAATGSGWTRAYRRS
jgi:hypothetical protein